MQPAKPQGKSHSKKRDRKRRPEAATVIQPARKTPGWLWPALIAACVLLFYWIPVTSPQASIQWDAADMHYPLQKYFSDHVRSGSLPFWTPYIFSGYPFLANPEVAAFYPPHWLFFLSGVTARSIQWELVLHAFLACFGAWLLISRLVADRAAAVLGGFAYGLSGFFAGHSSHVGLFAAAAAMPWLLLSFHVAVESGALLYTALGGLAGGMIILAGYAQTAVYAFAALGLYALAAFYRTPARWCRILTIVAGTSAIALAVAAVQVLPGLELTRYSIRLAYDFSRSSQGSLSLGSLATLFAPNALGAIAGPYTGPSDITQYYFYAGILLLPLAAIGVAKTNVRLPALVLIVPAAWYMLGPNAGLYRIGSLLPVFGKVRAPVQGWFVIALGLALLAAAGAAWLVQLWQWRYLAPVLIAVLFIDLWYWNSLANRLAYAHATFDDLYGNAEEATRLQIASSLPPLSRFDAPRALTALGPIDHPLDLRMETTYGYFALELAAYDDYTGAMQQNPKLRDGLNISRVLDVQHSRIDPNPGMLPRAYFPKLVVDVASSDDSRGALGTLNPADRSIALGPHAPVQQDAGASADILAHDEQSMRVRYRAKSPSLLRLSVPWFPGWHARIAGQEYPIVRVDHALMGVIVPAGEHDVEVGFQSNYFGIGLAATLAGLLCVSGLAAYSGLRRRLRAAQ